MATQSNHKPHRLTACFQYIPALFFVFWNLSFILFGFWAVGRDWSIKDKTCGQTSHVLKYCLLNVVFAIMNCLSYLLFPGGGEGARARAVVLIAFHFAFTVWGVLMRLDLQEACMSELSNHFQGVDIFQYMCCAHNGLFGLLTAVHECYLGNGIDNDFTLVPEKAPNRPTNYSPIHGHGGLGSPTHSPVVAQNPSMAADLKDDMLKASYSEQYTTPSSPYSPEKA